MFYYASDDPVLEGDYEKSSGNDFSDMVSCDDNNGYVYVMTNESMPGLVKIGMTTNSPEKRLKELSSATGVPTEFKLIYYREFKNCRMAEKKIHSILESRGTRYNNKREFFKIDTVEAINCILSIGDY